MKCPKCGYVGFESGEKCRNCGYDFSLIPEPARDLDLPLKADEPLQAPADFDFRTGDTPNPLPAERRSTASFDLELPRRAPKAAESELPLFPPATNASASKKVSAPEPAPSDRPTGAADSGAPRRAPRATPQEAPAPTRRPSASALRARPQPVPVLDFKDLDPGPAPEPPASRTPVPRSTIAGSRPAGPVARAVAGLVDASLLVGLNAAVLYFTLQICRLSFSDISILPAVPLLAFFLVLDGAYLVAFTAVGGQTIGKMAASVKVVSEDGSSVMPGQALIRAVGYLASILPAGLGFVPGLFGPSRRTLHDRLANTRVVIV